MMKGIQLGLLAGLLLSIGLLSGYIPFPPASPIAGEELILLAGFCIRAGDVHRGTGILAALANQLAREEGKNAEEIYTHLARILATTVRDCVLDEHCSIYDYFNWQGGSPPPVDLGADRAVDALIQSVKKLLQDKTGLTDTQLTLAAIWFIGEFARKASDQDEARWLLQEFGPALVVSIGWSETRRGREMWPLRIDLPYASEPSGRW